MTFISFFTDWFPGWTKKYSIEPSSRTPSEDCVELRQSFPGLAVTDYDKMISSQLDSKEVKKNQLYWSDQECREENWFICSKRIIVPPMDPKPLQGGSNLATIQSNCSVKVELTAEQPSQVVVAQSNEGEPFNCTYHISALDG